MNVSGWLLFLLFDKLYICENLPFSNFEIAILKKCIQNIQYKFANAFIF